MAGCSRRSGSGSGMLLVAGHQPDRLQGLTPTNNRLPDMDTSTRVLGTTTSTTTTTSWCCSCWWYHSKLICVVMLLLLLLTLCKPATATFYQPNSGSHDYCLDETFEARCGHSQVIQVANARYGRMNQGKCVKSDYGHVGCGNDVADILGRKCSGRAECKVVNIDATMKESALVDDCPKDLKSYLEADYTCLPVVTGKDNECRDYGEVTVTSSSGVIASGIDVTDLPDCPITIKGKEGQQIRITLIDYTDFSDDVSGLGDPQYCREYAVISELHAKESVIMCSGQKKEGEVYLSKNNLVKIELKATYKSELPSPYYLLKYEVFGCVLPPIHSGMYIAETTVTSLSVKCNNTDDEWLLTCHDNLWHGSLGNCSGASPEVAEAININRLLPYGISVLIIIAVAVFICILILIFGILHIKNKQRARDRMNQNHLLAPPGTPSVDSKIATLKRNPASTERSYSPMARTMRIPASGGEYAHIWELRRPIPVETPEVPTTDMATRQLPDPKEEQNRPNAEQGDRWARVSTFKPHVDHIYESPKFERRPQGGAEHRADGPVPFYYELDPNSPEVATLPRGEYPRCTCGLQQAALPLRQAPLGQPSPVAPDVNTTGTKETV